MKPMSTGYIVAALRGYARELKKPYESRDPDFEEDGAAYIMREAAKRLKKQEDTIIKLKYKER